MAIKVIIGLVIIVASFGYILKNHDKSMIENMQDKQQKRFEGTQGGRGGSCSTGCRDRHTGGSRADCVQ